MSAGAALRALSPVVAIDLLLVAWFVRSGWAWPVFRGWLVRIPDLRGTWVGHIQSNWKDPSGNGIGPIPTMLIIRQTFLHVWCVARTPEMTSSSYVAALRYLPERECWELNYSYTSNPLPRFMWRSPVHAGTARLVVQTASHYALQGEYWTQRNTTGEMKFTRYTRELVNEFRRDLWDHPMKARG